MLRTIVLLCCMAAYASAQNYMCSPANYCTSQGYPREDILGCQYFCYLDTAPPPNSLTCNEFHVAFNAWKGSAVDCDRTCYVNAHEIILPDACDDELNAAFDRLSNLDGVPGTISNNDINLWCEQVLAASGGGSVITPSGFALWWRTLYSEIGDPTCPTPFRRHG